MGSKKREEWRPTQFLIDPEIHRQLRIAAIEQGISMAEALREAVTLWLKTRQEKQKPAKGRSRSGTRKKVVGPSD